MPTSAQRAFYTQLEGDFGWTSTWKHITRNRNFDGMNRRRAYGHLIRIAASIAPYVSLLPDTRTDLEGRPIPREDRPNLGAAPTAAHLPVC